MGSPCYDNVQFLCSVSQWHNKGGVMDSALQPAAYTTAKGSVSHHWCPSTVLFWSSCLEFEDLVGYCVGWLVGNSSSGQPTDGVIQPVPTTDVVVLDSRTPTRDGPRNDIITL